MSVTTAPGAATLDAPPKRLNAFERYLTVWVGLCPDFHLPRELLDFPDRCRERVFKPLDGMRPEDVFPDRHPGKLLFEVPDGRIRGLAHDSSGTLCGSAKGKLPRPALR